jgi:hypothetical protein
MHDHGQIYSGIEGTSPGRFAALVTKHEVVTLGKLGEEGAYALGRAPVAAMSGFQIVVVHDCPERVACRAPLRGRSRETSHGSTRGFQAVFVSGVIWKPSADARRLSAAMLRWRCCSS